MRPQVSVIIPVYNAAKFLPACIQSLLAQTLHTIEFIFVNDGSTDASAGILHEAATMDPRIKLIETVNSGVSAARNTGLTHATGVFVGFVDADDTVSASMFENMHQAAVNESADLVVCDVFVDGDAGALRKRLHLPGGVFEIEGCRSQQTIATLRFRYDYANWNKLYRREIIEKCGLSFDTSMTVYEDLLFNLCFMQHAAKGIMIAEAYYYYRQHEASVMNRGALNRAAQLQLLWQNFLKYSKGSHDSDVVVIFKTELRRMLYNVVIPAITFDLVKSKSSLRLKARLLQQQLKSVDRGFFQYSPQELQHWKMYLLRYKCFTMFSFWTVFSANFRYSKRLNGI